MFLGSGVKGTHSRNVSMGFFFDSGVFHIGSTPNLQSPHASDKPFLSPGLQEHCQVDRVSDFPVCRALSLIAGCERAPSKGPYGTP